MELYAYRENGEFIGTIDFYTSLRWRRQYWTAGEVELHLPATKENLAAIQAGVILRRVGRTESARIMGIKTKGGEITANARMLEIYFSMAYVIGTKSFTGTPAEILCQLAEDARESVPELVVDKTSLPSGEKITIQLDFKNTLKAMTAVAKAYGLGFRLLFSENQQFTFQVYEGTDRSANQADNNIVYFTDEFQNFIDPEYSFDESDYCNVAYARGSDGTVVCVDRSNGGRKRVCFVDASSVTPDDKTEAAYLDELKTQCGWGLFDHIKTKNFTGTAVDMENFAYMQDWDLGDIVTTGDSSIGITMNERVTEVEEVYEKGSVTIYPVTGKTKSETLNVKTRRGVSVPLVVRSGSYMDDLVLMGRRWADIQSAARKIAKWVKDTLHLTIKDSWVRVDFLSPAEEHRRRHLKGAAKGCPGLDMAGYVMHRTYTTVRPGIFKRARRQYMRAGADLKRSHFIPLYRSYRLISYNGYFKGTKSRAAAEVLNQQKLFKSAKWAVRAAAIKERSLAV